MRFRDVYLAFYPSVHRFFRKRLGASEAEELTQETFLRIYKGLEGLHDQKSLSPWVFAVTVNVWRKRNRDRAAGKRHGTTIPLEAVPPLEDLSPHPLRNLLGRENAVRFRQAMSRLPTRMRTCFLLRYGRELEIHEIAEILAIADETVRVHLFKARQRIREELKDVLRDEEL